MQLYFATYWDGAAWVDLHNQPLPFKDAEAKATSALLDGRGTTRLRLANQTDSETDLSADQIRALHTYAGRYGEDWKQYLSIEWQCATASPVLHRLRTSHGQVWLEGFTLPPHGLS